MIIFADNMSFADRVVSPARQAWFLPADRITDVPKLSESLYGRDDFYESNLESDLPWKYLFVVEFAPRSHYDLLIELALGGDGLPDSILCLAGSGEGFHGMKKRPWSACRGNIHLSAHLTPARSIEQYGVAFTILAAVAVVDAIDSIPCLKGRAAIRWVNDVVVDGAKVCGVVSYMQTMNAVVSNAIIGIGLNVETRPPVEPTPFVPRVAALRDFVRDPESITQRAVFEKLMRTLSARYQSLLGGHYAALLRRYRELSLVLGRRVSLYSDEPGPEPKVIGTGRVSGLGEHLELFLEGVSKPVRTGRLILEDE